MSKKATLAARNVFYLARMAGITYDSMFKNRDDAAVVLNISHSRLSDIELGKANPYPDEIMQMAKLYHAPELLCYFCHSFCQIGKEIMPAIELLPFDRLMRKSTAALHRACNIQSEFIELGAETGILRTDDHEKLMRIHHELQGMMKVAMELDLYIKKNLKGCEADG